MRRAFKNIVGTMNVSEIDFMPEVKPKLINPKFYLVESGFKDGVYISYIYCIGTEINNPENDSLMCYSMFNEWRYSMNDSAFLDAKVIELIF